MKILEVQIIKTKSERVQARADVHFEGFWLKGFKIVRDPATESEFVTPPSYLSPGGWRPLFKTDSVQDWQEIRRRILEEYNNFQIKDSVNEIFDANNN